MAGEIADFVLEIAVSPGANLTISLGGVPPGDVGVSFASAFASGAAAFYVISDEIPGGQREVGIGTVTHGAPDTLTRTTVLGNSAGTTARLNFTGTCYVYNTIPAARAVYQDASLNTYLGDTAQVGSGTNGRAVLTRGDATRPGSLALFNATGVRQGYVGYGDGSNHLVLAAEGAQTGWRIIGTLVVDGSASAGGHAVVTNDGGTYGISISGSAASAATAGSAGTAGHAGTADAATTAASASSVPWGGVTDKPYIPNQNVDTGASPGFGGGLAVGGTGLAVTGAATGSTSGWQLAPGGPSAFAGGTNVAVNASGLDMLASRFIAASDGRVKPRRRRITAEEGLRFVAEVPAYLYHKQGADGALAWEAGFIAQDVLAADFPEIVLLTADPAMPAERYDSVGPAGQRYELIQTASIAYLAAALAWAVGQIETLTDRVAALEARPSA